MLSKELNMQISGWHLTQKSNIFQPNDFQVWSMVPEGHKSSQKHQVGFSSFEQSLETRANCHHGGAFFRNRFVAHQTAVGPTLTIIKGCVGPTKCKWRVTKMWSLLISVPFYCIFCQPFSSMHTDSKLMLLPEFFQVGWGFCCSCNFTLTVIVSL